MEVTKPLANFITSFTYERIEPALIGKVKMHLLDTLGCMLAGSREESARIVFNVCAGSGADNCSVVGFSQKLDKFGAPLVNGTSAHGLELDDGNRFTFVHLGASVVPAALAAAELEYIDGKLLLSAIIVGYETAGRIGHAVHPHHFRRGFHPTGTVGTFGAAAAAGYIFGLSTEQMQHALGIAGTQAAGLFEFGTSGEMVKRMHAGKAAQNGMYAACLAREGGTASDRILEARNGFLNVLGGESRPEIITRALGSEIMSLKSAYIKLHAACRHASAAIDLALELRDEGITPDTIGEMVLRIYKEGATFGNQRPTNFLAAQMSIPFAMAVALCTGKAGPKEFSPENIKDPTIAGLATRIKVQNDPELDELYPAKRPNRLLVTLKNGEQLNKSRDFPLGEWPEEPAALEQVNAKFFDLACTALREHQAKQVFEMVNRIEEQSTIDSLMEVLSMPQIRK